MRHEQPRPVTRRNGRYAAGTRVDARRSRAELERVVATYGASDFAVVDDGANAFVRFTFDARCVQLNLPAPDRGSPRFTRTPTGKERTFAAQERLYAQAVRENWRSLVLVVKGKLEAVDSGLSSFDDEFGAVLVLRPLPIERQPGRRRLLRRSSQTAVAALVLGGLVPGLGFLSLSVPHSFAVTLAAPVLGDQPDQFVADDLPAPVAAAEEQETGAGSAPAPVVVLSAPSAPAADGDGDRGKKGGKGGPKLSDEPAAVALPAPAPTPGGGAAPSQGGGNGNGNGNGNDGAKPDKADGGNGNNAGGNGNGGGKPDKAGGGKPDKAGGNGNGIALNAGGVEQESGGAQNPGGGSGKGKDKGNGGAAQPGTGQRPA